MRIGQAGIGIVLLSSLVACSHLRARTPAPNPALNSPKPPARAVIPVRVEPPPEPPEPEPATKPATPPATRARETPPATHPPDKPAQPPASTQTPADTPVLTTSHVAELNGKVNTLLDSADRDLKRIDYNSLDANAREQYNIAKRFVDMAREALKNRNFVWAHQLANSAAGLASQLVKK